MQIEKFNQIPQVNNRQKTQSKENPEFKGLGSIVLNGAGKFFQVCDDIPMIGVSFTDTAATNVPRTVVDLKETGVPAAAETARREFSGLFVNCLIPGAFVYGAAKLVNNGYMKDFKNPLGKPLDLSGSWANGESIENLVGVWKDYLGNKGDFSTLKGAAKDEAIQNIKNRPFGTKGFIKSALGKIEGLEGTDNWNKLSEHKDIINEAASILSDASHITRKKGLIGTLKYRHAKNQAIQRAYDVIMNGAYTAKDEAGKAVQKVVDTTGGIKAAQNLKFNGKSIGADLKTFLRDALDISNALSVSKTARLEPDKFIKRATGLVNAKSLMGLGVVIPLAMSMQFINRAITRHKYKKSGAPIYKDFEQGNRELTDKEKKDLRKTKPLAVASIVGLAALSMGKAFPRSLHDAVSMLQFNTKFPTLNQCRVIATSTFASRMIASEDPNELRESTVRDLASFAGLYFLGDYAEKLAATGIQKFSKAGREGRLNMFNRTKDPAAYKNVVQKLVGWVKDTSIKSFDEIPKEFKNYRSLAKLGGLGFSIALLGVFLPMYNKHVTNKKEAKRKAILEMQKKHNNIYNPQTVFPSADKTITQTPKTTALEESKKKFAADWEKYLKNKAFSKVASQCFK